MHQVPTVLVADSDDNRRRDLGLALYGGGYEVINAVDGDEAARFTTGLDPALVVIHEGLAGLEPLELVDPLRATIRMSDERGGPVAATLKPERVEWA